MFRKIYVILYELTICLPQQATAVATHMVKDFGMSDRVGLRTFEDTSGQLLGGSDVLGTTTKEAIDAEIKRLLQVGGGSAGY